MRRLLPLVLLVLLPPSATAQFIPTKEPTLEGRRATADLPLSQHKRNVGGSDGAGLCVYTSAWHAAIWQDCRTLFDFRAWMQRRPGGSYPEKFDATLKAYCAEKGLPVPGYVQHTGGDVEFLELALRTGRMPCITYCGVDGPSAYGNEVIAHMVNLCYLDRERAAILDNNFPGRWLWMTRTELLARWRGVKPDGSAFMVRVGVRWMPVGGGWAIVLLDPPPPPYPRAPGVSYGAANCPCGAACDCQPGACPGGCVSFGQQNCPDGRCPLVPLPALPAAPSSEGGKWVPHSNGQEWGYYRGATCIARCFRDGRCEAVDALGNATGEPIEPPAPLPFVAVAGASHHIPGGIDPTKMTAEESYSISGKPCSKRAAHDVLAASLTDDSARWHLTVVGGDRFCAEVKAAVEKLPAELRNKLHFHGYSPDAWPVTQFRLPVGVTLRRPAVGRVGSEVGTVSAGDYTDTSLAALLAREGGPAYTPSAPAPKPKTPDQPSPSPAPNPTPSPQPAPIPTPTPLPDLSGLGGWIVAAAILLAIWLGRRRG